MAKICQLCLVVVCAMLVEGKAFSPEEFFRAAANGDFQTLSKLVNPGFNDFSGFGRQLSGSVASLQPGPDSHVFGQAESSFSSFSNDNGRISKQSGGFGLINNDGKVTTYKFTPEDVFAPTESNNNQRIKK